MEAEGLWSGAACPRRLVLGSGVLALAVSSLACQEATTRADSAILVTLDTTRADAIAGFGGLERVTPNLARLEAEGIRFVEARTVTPLTLPSHASMVTGLVPPRHGVRSNVSDGLSDEAQTLAELCAQAGMRTGAFVSSAVLERAFGLGQGFAVYDEPGAGGRLHGGGMRSARETAARASAWLQELEAGEPFFLWVHLFDPHEPYEPEAVHLQQAGFDPYLGEVAACDAALGELIDLLRRRGDLDESILIVVADHGEGRGEHGEYGHGSLCYDSTLRVPLLVRLPVADRGGSTCDAVVSVTDVFPTVLNALGLPAPVGLDGSDLLSAEDADRGAYFESYFGYAHYGWSPLCGWIDASGKYIHSPHPELYRLAADKREENDLAELDPAACGRARERIAAVLARDPLGALGPRLDRSAQAELRALGYAGGAEDSTLPSPLEDSDRPSPRDRVEELGLLLVATSLIAAGRHAEAVPALQELVARNERHSMAFELMGFSLMNLGRFEEAAESYRRMMGCGPVTIDALTNLAISCERTGDAVAALSWFRLLLDLHPEDEVARSGVTRLTAPTPAAGSRRM